MKTTARFFLSGLLIAMVGGVQATTVSAGIWDKVNQVTGAINNTSSRVDQVNNAKNQVQGLGSKLPKPSKKNKNMEATGSDETSSGDKYELTKTTNPIKGEWGHQVTCAGPNSATCANGMDDMVNCMHQGKGYYYRLVAANLESRLGDQDLTKEDSTMLNEDIASLNDAVKKETDQVADPDPEYPQRWLAWLSKEDQQQINQMNSKYMNEVRQDCDDRFGGMARYSSGK